MSLLERRCVVPGVAEGMPARVAVPAEHQASAPHRRRVSGYGEGALPLRRTGSLLELGDPLAQLLDLGLQLGHPMAEGKDHIDKVVLLLHLD